MFHSCQINRTDNNEIELTPDSTKVFDNKPKVLQIKPGDYFELYAGVDKSNYLTAFYQSKYGDPSCCYFIQGSLQGLVTIRGIPVAVAGDAIGPHTIRAGKYCVPHGAIVNTGSTLVSAVAFR